MFEHYTDRATRAVTLAQEEARRLRHHHIGTEHLLLGLLREDNGVARRALESVGVTLDAARREVVDLIGQGMKTPRGHIPFTPRAKEVLGLALKEAHRMNEERVGTEHLLLALLPGEEGVARQMLGRLEVDLHALRDSIDELQLSEVPHDVVERVKVGVRARAEFGDGDPIRGGVISLKLASSRAGLARALFALAATVAAMTGVLAAILYPSTSWFRVVFAGGGLTVGLALIAQAFSIRMTPDPRHVIRRIERRRRP